VKLLLEVVLIVLLLLVFIQDMKSRSIHVILPLLIAGTGVYFFVTAKSPLHIVAYNLTFLLITFVGLYLYLCLKARKFSNPFHSIGLGDILFFIAIVPFFSTHNYILFFITGMLFSIIAFALLTTKSKSKYVPLAGFLALYMIVLKSVSYVADLDFYTVKPLSSFGYSY